MDEIDGMKRLGDEVRATVISQLQPNAWKVESPELPADWLALLKSRSNKLYQPGDEEGLWIYGFAPARYEVYLSDSAFGRLPITDAMRPRYVQALQSALSILSRGTDTAHVANTLATLSAEQISEVKGMFNRCLRQDQWDWFTIFTAFRYPKVEVLRQAASYFGELARAIRKRDMQAGERYILLLRGLELEQDLNDALKRIRESTPRLPSLTPLQATSHNVPLAMDTDVEDEPADKYIVSQAARAKRERANTSHQQTLRVLTNRLQSDGYLVEYSRLVDAYCRLKTGPAVFEIKSITAENERSQCRHALSQLYEYRYLHSLPSASLWLVLSSPPQLSWIVEYLMSDRHIEVLWVVDDEVGGPSAHRL